jgi:hypothetical protein
MAKSLSFSFISFNFVQKQTLSLMENVSLPQRLPNVCRPNGFRAEGAALFFKGFSSVGSKINRKNWKKKGWQQWGQLHKDSCFET